MVVTFGIEIARPTSHIAIGSRRQVTNRRRVLQRTAAHFARSAIYTKVERASARTLRTGLVGDTFRRRTKRFLTQRRHTTLGAWVGSTTTFTHHTGTR